MNPNMQVVAIPAPGTTGGRPRKEPLTDTEVLVGGGATTIPESIQFFQSYTQFRADPNSANHTQTKRFGRDTNLNGGQAGIPQNHQFFWYQWRCKLRTYSDNLSTAANQVIGEQFNRLRNMASVKFRFQQTDLMILQLDELPSGVGPQHIGGIQAIAADTLHLSLPNGVPDRGNAKDVTVNGKPVKIDALQHFEVKIEWPEQAAFQPLLDVFISQILEGTLIRGIV